MTEFGSGDISYKKVKTFNCLGTALNEINYVGVKIRSRFSAGNKYYYAPDSVISTSRKSKLKIYRAIIKPVVTHASEHGCSNRRK